MKAGDLAYLSLIRRKSSSLLAILAIGMAIGISGALVVLQQTLSDSFSNYERGVDAIIGPKSSSLRLLLDGLYFTAEEGEIIDYRQVKTLTEEIDPKRIVPFAVFATHRGFPIIGTNDSFLDLVRSQGMHTGKMVGEGRWFNLNTHIPEVVLGSRAAQALGLGPGDRFQARSRLKGRQGKPIWNQQVFVSGVLRESGLPHDRGVYAPIETAWEAHFAGHAEGVVHPSKMIAGVSWFAVAIDPEREGQMDRLRDLVQTGMVGQLVEVERELEWLKNLLGQGRNLTGAILLLALFLALSVLLLLFVERSEMTRRELGIYRALGYTKNEVFASILWEGLYLGISGMAIGMVLERAIHFLIASIWSPAWLSPVPWPSIPLVFLWIATLLAVLLIPGLAIIRLYRSAANETLAAY